jgi:hypothetical protein
MHSHCLNSLKQKCLRNQPGTIIILVMVVMIILFMNLAILSIVLVRGMGEEGILLSQNISARKATEIGIERLKKNIYDYFGTNGVNANIYTSPASGAFRQGGSDDIDGVTLQVQNPEGGAMETTPIRIWAWVSDKRGNYYQIKSRAVLGEIDLTTSRWELLYPCSANGQVVKPMNLTKDYYGNGGLDSKRDTLYFNSSSDSDPNWVWNEKNGTDHNLFDEAPDTYEQIFDGLSDASYFVGTSGSNLIYGSFEGTFVNTWSASGFFHYHRTYDTAHNRFYYIVNDGTDYVLNYLEPQEGTGGMWNQAEAARISRNFAAGLPDSSKKLNNDKLAVDETTGRVFFLDDQCANTWSAESGFTELGCGFSANAVANYSPGAKRYTIGNGGRATNSWTPERGWEATHSDAGNIAPSGQLISSERTGRLFFVHGTSMYTWLNGKLDLLVTDSANLGTSSRMLYDEARERFYFADNDNLYSWTKSGGLVTVVSGGTITAEAFKLDEGSGQLYFRGTTSNGQGVHWTTGTTSAIIPSSLGQSIRRWGVDPVFSRFYFATPDNLYSWKNDSVGTRLIRNFGTNSFSSGGMFLLNSKTGRLYFYAGPAAASDIYYYNPPELCAANFATTSGVSGASGGSGGSSGGCGGGGSGPVYCEVTEEI